MTNNTRPDITEQRLLHARASIADSERAENSLGTRVDAAVQAICFLDQSELHTTNTQWLLTQEYLRMFDEAELRQIHQRTLEIAKYLLAKAEQS